MGATELFNTLINFSGFPLNFIHLLLYYRLRKANPVRLLVGLALLTPLFWVRSGLGLGLPSQVEWLLLLLIYFFYNVLILRFFILEGSFSRIFFGVLSVGVYRHLIMTCICTVLLRFDGHPADSDVFYWSRVIFLLSAFIFYPLLYRYVRPLFIRILDVVEKENWYVNGLTPLMLYILASLSLRSFLGSPAVFSSIVSLMPPVALIGYYAVIYKLVMNRDLNIFLKHQLAMSRQLIQMYDLYDEELAKKERTLKLMRHDLRHMLGRLDALALAGDAEAIRRCISDLADSTTEFDLGSYSDHRVVNAVISYHFSLAAKSGIKCSASVLLSQQQPLNEPELAVLIGNALENCVKAAAPLGPEGRTSFIARPVKDRMGFKFENNYTEGEYSQGEGLGLRSIRVLCVQHGGVMETRRADGQFLLTVILPLREKKQQLESL